ncbi:hypothetical protein [Niabella drilacis]|uniref:Uncharacterized protein n=1 Tax=Niabella drilacis (strain DSM 25811 / CCM 8410 / CCUG 62505 / LMG 26954 / E90) TaxID=1285928 RepID=A0A1G6I6C3_NIADE|nr:hypothetical protein [Niabella drilacis]SDC02082.1 hypothetical protein SAMN04487894_101112 [Niabella drilacis]
MKKMKAIFIVVTPLLMLACSKSNNREEPDLSNAYIIEVDNSFSPDKAMVVKFRTSLETEKTVTVPAGKTDVKIPVKAAVGEYVRFSVSKTGSGIVKVYDPKGGLIADYSGFPGIDPTVTDAIVYDFIAFDPDDQVRDPLQYKTGIAKTAADKLLNKPYLIDKRYFIENENITDNMGSQMPCFLTAEYYLRARNFSVPVFNPDLLLIDVEVRKGEGGCTHVGGDTYPPYPQETITRINNKDASFAFPVWDPANPGTPIGVGYSNFTLDSINAAGVITFHKDLSATKKEVFVYRLK